MLKLKILGIKYNLTFIKGEFKEVMTYIFGSISRDILLIQKNFNTIL